MMGATLRLSPVEITACWEALGLDLPPAQLTGFGPGSGFDRPMQRAALASLARRGLSDGVRPSTAVAHLLRFVARPEHRIDLRWGSRRGGRLAAVGAMRAHCGVTVVHSDGYFTVTAMDSARIAANLLGLLGPIEAGEGRPANMPADIFDTAIEATTSGSLWDLADQLRARGVARLDASSLAHMCQGMHGRGQLGATGYVQGQPTRAPWVIGVHQTPTGWYTQIRRGGTVTVNPVDEHQLLRHWHTLITKAQNSRVTR